MCVSCIFFSIILFSYIFLFYYLRFLFSYDFISPLPLLFIFPLAFRPIFKYMFFVYLFSLAFFIFLFYYLRFLPFPSFLSPLPLLFTSSLYLSLLSLNMCSSYVQLFNRFLFTCFPYLLRFFSLPSFISPLPLLFIFPLSFRSFLSSLSIISIRVYFQCLFPVHLFIHSSLYTSLSFIIWVFSLSSPHFFPLFLSFLSPLCLSVPFPPPSLNPVARLNRFTQVRTVQVINWLSFSQVRGAVLTRPVVRRVIGGGEGEGERREKNRKSRIEGVREGDREKKERRNMR